ncbi:MAG TPA: ketopantoate reductase family protein [Terriglobales bacterium]|nr:ketopantoate reductase family protein [Terriglobales bacterium]
MKHAILGVGAIGGLVGTALGSLGLAEGEREDVIVVVRAERLAGYPASLVLERPSATLTTPVKAVASLADPVDVLWIATKTYQLEPALREVQVEPGCVIPLLNGVDHMAALRGRFGRERVVAATIAVEAERTSPGRFIQRSPFVRLNLASSGKPLLERIVQRLSSLGFTCQFIENEETLLWSKLCFLGPFALATSASGKNIGEVLADPAWKAQLLSAIAEACAVARACGASVDTAEMQAMFNAAPPGMRSSMQKDLAAGRQLELDAIGGAIIRGGERAAIDVSTTAQLMAAIQAKDRNR